jgi:hypothetical protein
MGYIYLRNKGGLGNQLFIYNFGLFISSKYGLDLILDNTTGFFYDKYGRSPVVGNLLSCNFLEATFLQKLLFIIHKKLPFSFRIIFNVVQICEKSHDKLIEWNELQIRANSIVYVDGYFQDIYYIKNNYLKIRDYIKKQHNFNIIYENYNAKINSTNSVCVHIRRNAYDNLLTIDYYVKSMDLIRNTLSNPVFYVFSDSLEWCRNNILGSDLVFIENEGQIDDLQEFFLMKNCRHFIIANSTYSWWGAFLGGHFKKMVIAPLYNQLGDNNSLYPQNWICI